MSSPKRAKQQNEELERKLGNMIWIHDESQDQLRSIANDTCGDTVTLRGLPGLYAAGLRLGYAAGLRLGLALLALLYLPLYALLALGALGLYPGLLGDLLRGRQEYADAVAVALRTNSCLSHLDAARWCGWMNAGHARTIASGIPPHRNITVVFEDPKAQQAFDNATKKRQTTSANHAGPSVAPKAKSKPVPSPSSVKTSNPKHDQRVAALEKQLEATKHKLTAAKDTIQQLREQSSQMQAENQRLLQKVERLEHQAQQQQSESNHLQDTVQQLQTENHHLQNKTSIKENWEAEVERIFNLSIPSSSFDGKTMVTDASGKPVSGASGHLFKAAFAGHPVALKQMFAPHPPRFLDVLSCRAGGDDVPDHVKQLRREALILLSMRHPNVVSFLGLSYNDNAKTLCFVLSWAEGGSLHDHLHVRQLSLDKATALRILLEVASALAFMHAHNIVHRDLKSPNILLDGALSAKVTDFGLSTFREADKSVVSKVAGTELWASPEQLLNLTLRFDTDVYSFGVIMWEVLLHCKPWHHGQYAGTGANLAVLILAFNSGQYLPLEDTINGKVLQEPERELLRGCFASQGSRLTFSQLQDALTAQHRAAAETEALNVQEQTVLLHGPADAKWKFDASFLQKVEARMVTLTARPSARIAPLDLGDPDSQTVVKQLMADAGGRTAEESDLLAPFGRAVAGAAITQCSQKNAAFTGAVSRNKTRLRGHLSTKTHLFAPKYTFNAKSGRPSKPEDRAVLSRVTLFPADGSSSSSGLHTYKVLDDAMLEGDPHLRLQRVFHGVRSFDAVTGILGGDFAALQKLDGGWYGAGFYFTPDLDYALAYAAPCCVPSASSLPVELQGLGLSAGKQYRIVLACDVQYGNPYPVLDHTTHSGQALQAGHDAHVTVIDFSSGGIGGAKPLKSSKWGSKRTAAEVVISDPSCVLVRGVLVFKA